MHIYTYIKHTTTNRIKQPFRAGGARSLLPPLQEKKTFFKSRQYTSIKNSTFKKAHVMPCRLKKQKSTQLIYVNNLCIYCYIQYFNFYCLYN